MRVTRRLYLASHTVLMGTLWLWKEHELTTKYSQVCWLWFHNTSRSQFQCYVYSTARCNWYWTRHIFCTVHIVKNMLVSSHSRDVFIYDSFVYLFKPEKSYARWILVILSTLETYSHPKTKTPLYHITSILLYVRSEKTRGWGWKQNDTQGYTSYCCVLRPAQR